MRFVLSDDQLAFREVTRDFLDREVPLDGAVDRLGAGLGRATWVRLADQLGLHGLLVPESRGGLGGSFLDLAMGIAETGRALSDLPLLSSAGVATALLVRAADEPASDAAAQLLARVVDDATVVVVVPPSGDPARVVRDDDGWRLTGSWRTVLDLPWAAHVLVLAPVDDAGGTALFAVDLGAAAVGVDTTACPALDPTRAYGDLDLVSAHATWVAADPEGMLRDLAVASARAGLALDAAGGARRCLEIAVEYAGTREQFGRPIGSFQAVKHTCANMLVAVEAATSAAEAAAWELSRLGADAAPGAALRAATLAKSYAGAAYVGASADLIQILGGIGFTWEHPAHLFFKRAKASSLLMGTPDAVRAEEARALDLLSTS